MCDLYSIMKFILVRVLSFRSKYILILLSEIVYKYQSVSWLMKTDRWFVIFTDFLSSWLITKTGNKVFNSNDEFGYLCSLSYQILLMYFNTRLLDAHAFRVAMSYNFAAPFPALLVSLALKFGLSDIDRVTAVSFDLCWCSISSSTPCTFNVSDFSMWMLSFLETSF